MMPYSLLKGRKCIKIIVLKIILTIAKYTGIFYACRIVTSQDLRILCYHGVSINDESEFSPGLFMKVATLTKRMEYLKNGGFPVIGLEEGIRRLKAGTLPRDATVITIDDGWYGTYKLFYPILRNHEFPATLYVASHYFEKQTQVFNVALSYILWKSQQKQFNIEVLCPNLLGEYNLSILHERQEVATHLNRRAEELESARERQQFLRAICDKAEVNWESLEAERVFCFINKEEAKEMLDHGISIQLHTHRHRFSALDASAVRREIEDNRAALVSVAGESLSHFCYPSGHYSPDQVEILSSLGIVSATTTNPGFNRRNVNLMELSRFLDSERISNLEWEAEMMGFFEVIRRTGYKI